MTDLNIDWFKIPAPTDDGATEHLINKRIPDIRLPSTNGKIINLSLLTGKAIIYAYPRTANPKIPSFDGWDMIPGARGCTPQSCAFRDHFVELQELGIDHLFGLSTQDTAYQQEVVERLHLPFSLLSDEHLLLTKKLNLPTFEVNGITLLKRFTLVIHDSVIKHIFYPIFPPSNNPQELIDWLKIQRR